MQKVWVFGRLLGLKNECRNPKKQKERFMDNKTALLIIDVQKGFDDFSWGKRNNSDAEKNIQRLLEFWRSQNRPVIHVQHNSTNPNSKLYPNQAGWEFKEEVLPKMNEPIFHKTVNSAFIGTNLENYLHEQSIVNLVIVGLTTDHCVSTTTRMAANLGFKVFLVENATATFCKTGINGEKYTAEVIHSVNLASLNGEFCQVIRVEKLLN